MSKLDEEYISVAVSNRYGLQFDPSKEEFDGEVVSVIRPHDIEKPNGFAITISSTTRLIEAGFRADNFSGRLLRMMGESDSNQISAFIEAIQLLKQQHSCEINLNGSTKSEPGDCFEGDRWESFELTCYRSFDRAELKDPVQLNELASKVAIDLLNAILTLLRIEESTKDLPLYESGLPEGAKIKVEINKYERNPVNRARCIEHYGYSCWACGFNFEKQYGEVGVSFIEVHHVVPVSKMGEEYIVNPIDDLIPVCSNCHSMMHRRDPPFSVDEIKLLIKEASVKNCETSTDVKASSEYVIKVPDSPYE